MLIFQFQFFSALSFKLLVSEIQVLSVNFDVQILVPNLKYNSPVLSDWTNCFSFFEKFFKLFTYTVVPINNGIIGIKYRRINNCESLQIRRVKSAKYFLIWQRRHVRGYGFEAVPLYKEILIFIIHLNPVVEDQLRP